VRVVDAEVDREVGLLGEQVQAADPDLAELEPRRAQGREVARFVVAHPRLAERCHEAEVPREPEVDEVLAAGGLHDVPGVLPVERQRQRELGGARLLDPEAVRVGAVEQIDALEPQIVAERRQADLDRVRVVDREHEVGVDVLEVDVLDLHPVEPHGRHELLEVLARRQRHEREQHGGGHREGPPRVRRATRPCLRWAITCGTARSGAG
jgi:hypothetical protein